jgi:hypothetical protein
LLIYLGGHHFNLALKNLICYVVVCLVLAWKIGFSARCIDDKLSQKILT